MKALAIYFVDFVEIDDSGRSKVCNKLHKVHSRVLEINFVLWSPKEAVKPARKYLRRKIVQNLQTKRKKIRIQCREGKAKKKEFSKSEAEKTVEMMK